MRTLILIRHAKSSWDSPMSDFDRPLMKIGVENALLVASEALNYLPENYIIWSSPAKRAFTTAMLFAQNFNYPVESVFLKEELYTFDSFRLEQCIKTCPDAIENLIIFGHNEAITDFVNKFGNIFIDNVTTSGFVSITFETNSWQNITEGKTTKVIFPKDLK